MNKIKKYFWIVVSRIDKYLLDYAILKFFWDREVEQLEKYKCKKCKKVDKIK